MAKKTAKTAAKKTKRAAVKKKTKTVAKAKTVKKKMKKAGTCGSCKSR